jgi:hypothetical protein
MSHGDALHPLPYPRPNEADEETVERIIDELEPPDTIKTHECGEIDLRAPWKLPT